MIALTKKKSFCDKMFRGQTRVVPRLNLNPCRSFSEFCKLALKQRRKSEYSKSTDNFKYASIIISYFRLTNLSFMTIKPKYIVLSMRTRYFIFRFPLNIST
jgi:hypothetical protein